MGGVFDVDPVCVSISVEVGSSVTVLVRISRALPCETVDLQRSPCNCLWGRPQSAGRCMQQQGLLRGSWCRAFEEVWSCGV